MLFTNDYVWPRQRAFTLNVMHKAQTILTTTTNYQGSNAGISCRGECNALCTVLSNKLRYGSASRFLSR
ncbi:hypothetical protein EUGRSUZ_H04412 [Eucalyptus grandis]|uniref:Uncharacterized protein n=2 Tax=Eucalyptus grandis TaxID=71139 RepID=A0ACC3JXL2_EUCGR|nr:hypothetical protein EUGRSUZ_H04412 [Eucalyptus grandis]